MKTMFIPNKIKNSETGAILITIIMFTIVLSLIAVGLMGVNLSHIRSSQSVVDEIKAEQIALGTFYRYHQINNEGCAQCPTPNVCTSCNYPPVNLDGRNFAPAVSNNGDTATSPDATEEIAITVNY